MRTAESSQRREPRIPWRQEAIAYDCLRWRFLTRYCVHSPTPGTEAPVGPRRLSEIDSSTSRTGKLKVRAIVNRRRAVLVLAEDLELEDSCAFTITIEYARGERSCFPEEEQAPPRSRP